MRSTSHNFFTAKTLKLSQICNAQNLDQMIFESLKGWIASEKSLHAPDVIIQMGNNTYRIAQALASA